MEPNDLSTQIPAMTPKERFSRLGLALLAIAALSLGGQILTIGFIMILVPDRAVDLFLSGLGIWLLSFLPMYCTAIPVGLLIMRGVPAQKDPGKPLSPGGFWKYLLMCFPILVGGNMLGGWLAEAFSGGMAENPLESLTSDVNVLNIVFTVILAPVLEELVFRQNLIDRTAAYGEKTAVLFSALCFGMFHMNLYQFFYAFGIGVILGYVYLRTRDLRYSIGMHMIVNFMGGVAAPWLSAKVQTLDPDLLGNMQNLNFMLRVYGSELQKALAWVGAFGLYLLVYLGFAIAGLVLLVQNWHRALFLPAAEELPREIRGKTVYGNVGMILFLAATAVMTVITLL